MLTSNVPLLQNVAALGVADDTRHVSTGELEERKRFLLARHEFVAAEAEAARGTLITRIHGDARGESEAANGGWTARLYRVLASIPRTARLTGGHRMQTNLVPPMPTLPRIDAKQDIALTAILAGATDGEAAAKAGVLREPTERVRSLTTDEESRLRAELNVQAGRITRLALLTGMRQSEVIDLRKNAVDLEHGTVTLTDTKNGEPRVVYLNDEAAAVVREAIAISPGHHVFVSRTKKPYTADEFRAVFRRACDRAKVTNFRFHDTRHTTATRRAEERESPAGFADA